MATFKTPISSKVQTIDTRIPSAAPAPALDLGSVTAAEGKPSEEQSLAEGTQSAPPASSDPPGGYDTKDGLAGRMHVDSSAEDDGSGATNFLGLDSFESGKGMAVDDAILSASGDGEDDASLDPGSLLPGFMTSEEIDAAQREAMRDSATGGSSDAASDGAGGTSGGGTGSLMDTREAREGQKSMIADGGGSESGWIVNTYDLGDETMTISESPDNQFMEIKYSDGTTVVYDFDAGTETTLNPDGSMETKDRKTGETTTSPPPSGGSDGAAQPVDEYENMLTPEQEAQLRAQLEWLKGPGGDRSQDDIDYGEGDGTPAYVSGTLTGEFDHDAEFWIGQPGHDPDYGGGGGFPSSNPQQGGDIDPTEENDLSQGQGREDDPFDQGPDVEPPASTAAGDDEDESDGSDDAQGDDPVFPIEWMPPEIELPVIEIGIYGV